MNAVKGLGARLGLILLSAIVLPQCGFAQYVPPRIELEALSKNEYPHIDTDDIVVGDCPAISASIPNAQTEEIGTIRIMLYAPWYRTADHLAQEKAGDRGANCLVRQSPSGLVNASYPLQTVYKAFRLTAAAGFGSLAARYPVGKSQLSAAALPPSAQPQATAAGAAAPGHDHLWPSGNFIYRYEIGMDTSKFSAGVWEDISNDFKDYFPRKEYEELLEAHRRKSKVLVDFKNMRIKRIQ
jgi:hypothetical protein